jgi:predicted DNA-binding transcriptional regulator AlpA
MPKHKRKSRSPESTPVRDDLAPTAQIDANALLPGPKLRQILGVSPVTLWRWRHDESMRFPKAKSIQGRLYFPWKAVAAWLAAQQEAA